mmetsp:Transcript_51878/g.151018  ORF Transcript_51878/g.151018 Transcript_51878/m.151018 type:complete len:364 (-) Transcript_51878:1434-2525(-)
MHTLEAQPSHSRLGGGRHREGAIKDGINVRRQCPPVLASHCPAMGYMQADAEGEEAKPHAAERLQHYAERVAVEPPVLIRGIDLLVDAEGSEALRRQHHEHEARELAKCGHRDKDGLLGGGKRRPGRYPPVDLGGLFLAPRALCNCGVLFPRLGELVALQLDFLDDVNAGDKHCGHLGYSRDQQRNIRQHREHGVGTERALPGDEGAGQNARRQQQDDGRRAEKHLWDVDLDDAATDACRPVGASDEDRHLGRVQAFALHDGLDRTSRHGVHLDELLDLDLHAQEVPDAILAATCRHLIDEGDGDGDQDAPIEAVVAEAPGALVRDDDPCEHIHRDSGHRGEHEHDVADDEDQRADDAEVYGH